jgi:hypothetical protein
MIENMFQGLVLSIIIALVLAITWWSVKTLWRAFRWFAFPRQSGHMTLSNRESINFYAVKVAKEESKRFKGPKLLSLM